MASRSEKNLIVVLGPTASGKTGLAVRLARRIDGEIISADSRQVYRGMDLGTGKDLTEYTRGGERIPCHLIDIVDPAEEFSLFAFRERFDSCFTDILKRGKRPLMVGGSGLYLDSVIRGYRMAAVQQDRNLRTELAAEEIGALRQRLFSLALPMHNVTDLQDRERIVRAIEIGEFAKRYPPVSSTPIPVDPLVIGIRRGRQELRDRIGARLKARLEAGMVEEVRRLADGGISWERIDAFGLEYRYVGRYLQGEMTFEAMHQTLHTRICQYAKRQETWFRGMERKGVSIHWIDGDNEDEALSLIDEQGTS